MLRAIDLYRKCGYHSVRYRAYKALQRRKPSPPHLSRRSGFAASGATGENPLMALAQKHRFALRALAGLAATAAIAGLAMIYSGAYDVSAIRQHTHPVHWALDTAMRQAVKLRARGVKTPPLDDPALAQRGAVLYRGSCLQCHGAPGIAPEPFARGLMPLPNSLAQTALERTPAEMYWVTKNGLKMTGMPAWEYRYADEELWAIVAFLRQLPKLTVESYEALAKKEHQEKKDAPTQAVTSPDARRGAVALNQYACTSCHRIPGIVGATAHVGPPLEGIAGRKYLAGRLPNTPENMLRWIREPKSVNPATLMPDLDVTEAHARDIAAYLATLD
jgi:mono/diheme cytochrome c family protein/cytochrome c551/c552